MTWKEVSKVGVRKEFVGLARQAGANVRELCRRYGISPTTGYKWIGRAEQAEPSYEDRSRKPHRSPRQTDAEVEKRILEIRDEHPVWNARKIRRVLEQKNPEIKIPAASTVGQILKRHGRIGEKASQAASKWQRFEHAEPNELSQMDYKGYFLTEQGRCYGLTMLDDHSRFAQILQACADEKTETVQKHLIAAFRRYGLPKRMNMDNGHPWGNVAGGGYTRLTVWLIRLGVRVSHSRPHHPQTNGKDERFHRTLKAEVLTNRSFSTLVEVQAAFDRWREIYNQHRPHEALGLAVPASRYRMSPRSYPEILPEIEYSTTDCIKKVRGDGSIRLWNRNLFIGEAFIGQYVALRPTEQDHVWSVHFCRQHIANLDQRTQTRLLPSCEPDLSALPRQSLEHHSFQPD